MTLWMVDIKYFVIMGGHGGLNILPQKKWNVYNWDNRQIVDKDKKLHAEKKRREYEAERENALDNKISVLKGDIVTQEIEDRPLKEEKKVHSLISMEMRKIADQEKHINLFEEEERILMNRELSEVKRMKEEEFLKDKNMDFSSKFLGTYTEERNMPWYSKKKGAVQEKRKNRHYRPLDDVIEGVKSDSRVTKQIIEVEKKEEKKAKEEHERDRTREKFYSKYEDYEDRYARVEKVESRISKDLMKHQQQQLLRQFQKDKNSELEKLRAKRLQREEKERQRVEELKKKLGSDAV